MAEDETQKPDTTKDDKTVEENPDKAPEEKDEKPVENADDNADTKDKAEDEKILLMIPRKSRLAIAKRTIKTMILRKRWIACRKS